MRRGRPRRSINRGVSAIVSSPFAPPDSGGPAGPQRSLVLAGGEMRVAYQAGVLAALEQAPRQRRPQ
jgi:predicted acylesterase/phospholipase RssA